MYERCRECGKKNYPTYMWAKAMAKVQEETKGWEAYPYHCNKGEFWHLNTPNEVKRKTRGRLREIATLLRSLYEQRSNSDNSTSTQLEEG